MENLNKNIEQVKEYLSSLYSYSFQSEIYRESENEISFEISYGGRKNQMSITLTIADVPNYNVPLSKFKKMLSALKKYCKVNNCDGWSPYFKFSIKGGCLLTDMNEVVY